MVFLLGALKGKSQYVMIDWPGLPRVSFIFALHFVVPCRLGFMFAPQAPRMRTYGRRAPTIRSRRNVMKLDKKQAIARRNQELGGAVLGTNNCHFAELNRNRNIWWFDLPVTRLAVGQYEWIHLLMHTPATDELLHLKVPTVFLREKLEGLVIRNEGKRKAALSLELSADKDSYLQDMRPAGTNVNFAPFRQ